MLGFLKFFIPSLLGLLLFVVPVKDNGSFNVVIGILAKFFQTTFKDELPTVITIILTFSGALSLVAPKITFIKSRAILKKIFVVSPFLIFIRFLSAIICYLCLNESGPSWLVSKDTGGLLLYELMPVLFSVFLFASVLLALLVNFGLLEFLGSILSKVMRPLFKLPGRSAIDCLASWVGDGTVGILLTSKQYEKGYYTAKEACIIGTTFSVVSITFSLVVISHVKLSHMFFPFYLTVALAGFACAIIIPRIPPLSRKPDTRCVEVSEELTDKSDVSVFKKGLRIAIKKASENTLLNFLKDGFSNLLDMWIGVLPSVMVIGTLSLLIAVYTPLFSWLGMPLIPLLELFNIPEAHKASESLVVGFADMFLPVVIGSDIKSELTRFVIAATSVSQLIFMTETGGLLLGSKIPINFIELFVIFILRTIISLPIIVLMAHCFFS